jgi:hypothetical protein
VNGTCGTKAVTCTTTAALDEGGAAAPIPPPQCLTE